MPSLPLRALTRPRNLALLAVFVVLVGLRLGLPYVLRWQLVEQADAALVGRVDLADLDLSLLRGGVTLHGVAVHARELPATGAAPESPVFEARRLWAQISGLALLGRTLEIEELELDGFAVRIERTRDGLVLRVPVAAAPSGEPQPVPVEEPPSAWFFAAGSVALRDGRLALIDHTVGEPAQELALNVRDLSAPDLAFAIDPAGGERSQQAPQRAQRAEGERSQQASQRAQRAEGERSQPGRARIGEGSLGLDASVEQRREGPSVVSRLRLVNLPVGDARPYLAMFGWRGLAARLDAELEHRFASGGAHELAGRVALSDVAVEVPGLEPVAFEPGSSELGTAGRGRVDELAALLAASPGLGLRLRGATSDDDVRVQKEQALLAELQETSGLRALGQLGEIGTRRAVRRWLGSALAAQSVDAEQLGALADARAATVQRALVAGHGIAALERLVLEPASLAPEPTLARVDVAIAEIRAPEALPQVGGPGPGGGR
jgi:hypothetical protein